MKCKNMLLASLILSARMSATGATLATFETSTPVGLDTRTDIVRTAAAATDVHPLAWNSDTNWAAGGASGVSAEVTVTTMAGDGDPESWMDVGGAATIVSGSGENAAAWSPAKQSRYRAALNVGGATTATAYFDLTETQGLAAGTSVGDAAITLSPASYTATGDMIVPGFTILSGGVPLAAGTDYVVQYVDNRDVGTGTLKIYGVGDYAGQTNLTFAIVSATPEEIVSSAASDGTALHSLDGALVYNSPRMMPMVAWNSGEAGFAETNYFYVTDGAAFQTNMFNLAAWPAGGKAAETARISAAPLASENADPGEFTVVSEVAGEGAFHWKPGHPGWWLLKFEVSAGGVYSGACFTRTINVRGLDGLYIYLR